MKKLAILFVLASSMLLTGQRSEKYNIKVSHLGSSDVAIVCLDGTTPTGSRSGNVLIISCGK
jgi:hypothetical protein